MQGFRSLVRYPVFGVKRFRGLKDHWQTVFGLKLVQGMP